MLRFRLYYIIDLSAYKIYIEQGSFSVAADHTSLTTGKTYNFKAYRKSCGGCNCSFDSCYI